jgi:hypothetical protein
LHDLDPKEVPMRAKNALLVVFLSLTFLAGTAAAQAPATFLLRSGERISGDLIELDASGYHIIVNGQERRIAPDDLAVIDFTGRAQDFPATETQKLIPGQHLIVLHDGEMHAGKMNDVGGTRPKLIYFAYPGGPQNITSDRVARIYLSSPPAATAGTGGSAAQIPPDQPGTVRVVANRPWTSTGIAVQKGQLLRFSASGQVQLSQDVNDVAPITGKAGRQVSASGSLPDTLGGALLGRIGNGRPFPIGNQTSITAPQTGLLYLGVNDDMFTDNSGEFVVTVTGGTPTGTGIRRR